MGLKERRKKTQYRRVPTTIISSNGGDHRMSIGITTLRVLLWLFTKTIIVIYVPFYIANLFKKPKPCSPIQNEILLLRATDLADRIRKQELTSENVVRAYISRIQEVNPVINAIIEDRFKQAIEDAKYADKLIAFGTMSIEELKAKHPLLGVPLTVKGSINVANMKNTSGMLSRANAIAKEDAVSVKHAREAGAIPLITSNVPELCMNWETTNKLQGTTKNPHNTTRTVGGSSGGEASLLSSAASIIGIGSDIGGSLRLPAHFCGVWGHKPTPGAVSYVGHYPSCQNHDQWEPVFTLGPMARYATDLKFFLQIIAEPSMREGLMLDEPVNLTNLKVYYIEDIHSSLTSTVNNNCLDALRKVINHFDTICHRNCEKVKLPLMKYAPEMASLALLDIDDVDNLFTGRGEGSYGELFKFITCRSKSMFTTIAYGLLRNITGRLPRSMIKDIKKKLEELRSDFLKLLGNDGVFILPSFPGEAHHHGDIITKLLDSGYLSIFNALGFPVTNCPVTFTDQRLPVGVQVVGAPNCDRLTLAVAIEIEKTFGGWLPPTVVGQVRA